MMSDSWRLAIGTFTRLPVPAPRRVDRTIAGRTMSLGPLVGALMAAVSGIPLLAVGVLAMGVLAAGTPGSLSLSLSLSLLAAVLTVGAQAWLTRGLHLDGLADTADGLGGGTSPERAQAIARASDIGPFGVIAVVLVVALNQKTVAFPCAQYAGTTLASDVSVECLQYLWDKSCLTRPYSFPASYAGWWRSSPQGGTLVRYSVTPCGVGSYDNMRTYIQLCNVNQ